MACECVLYKRGNEQLHSAGPKFEEKTLTSIKDFYYLTNHITCLKLKCLKCDAFSYYLSSQLTFHELASCWPPAKESKRALRNRVCLRLADPIQVWVRDVWGGPLTSCAREQGAATRMGSRQTGEEASLKGSHWPDLGQFEYQKEKQRKKKSKKGL